MAVNPAVMTLWSSRFLDNLDKLFTYDKMSNRNYEGELKGKGDVLKIFSVARPTVAAYAVGTDITWGRQRPTPQNLNIDQDDYWAEKVDKLEDRLASIPFFTALINGGRYQFANKWDQFLAALMFNGKASANALTGQIVGTGAGDKKAYDLLVDMRVQLGTQNLPDGAKLGVVVPWWFYGMLEKDNRFTGYGTDKNRATLRGEPLGEVQEMQVYRSTNVPTSATTTSTPTVASLVTDIYAIIAAWDGATTAAWHIADNAVEVVEQFENNFDKGVRSRFAYGATVTHPEGIVTCNVTQGS